MNKKRDDGVFRFRRFNSKVDKINLVFSAGRLLLAYLLAEGNFEEFDSGIY